MKKIVFVIFTILISSVYAEKTETLTPEQRKARAFEFRMKNTGGMISRPDTPKGKVVLFYGQNEIQPNEIEQSIRLTFSLMRASYEIKTISEAVSIDNASELMKKYNAAVGIFILNDSKINVPMLIAPEAGWALVNIAVLKKDNPNSNFLKARTNKEIVRAILHVCGGASSMYDGSISKAIVDIKELDDIVSVNPPIDVIGRTAKYLPAFGVSTSPKVTYKKAVQEGWAPTPTNEYQKAIWDKVHAAPKNPMKIEFDPKKGR